MVDKTKSIIFFFYSSNGISSAIFTNIASTYIKQQFILINFIINKKTKNYEEIIFLFDGDALHMCYYATSCGSN